MKKLWIIAAVLIGLIAAALLFQKAEPEPSYAGKPFSFWFEQFYAPNTNGFYNRYNFADREEALYALRKMGADVYPLLVKEYLVSDRRIKFRGYCSTLKQWIFQYRKNPAPYISPGQIRFEAGEAIRILGPSAQTLLPLLHKALRPGSEDYSRAIYLLGSVSEGREQVVPILASALKQPGRARQQALQSLTWMGESADAVLPELLQRFQKVSRIPRLILLVGNAGPNAKAAVTELQKLCAPGNGLETYAAAALYQIEPENKTALNLLTNWIALQPEQLRNLAWSVGNARRIPIQFILPLATNSDEQVRAQAIKALEKKSPQAAVNALENLLRIEPESEKLQTARWLLRIDRNNLDAQKYLLSRRYSSNRKWVLESLSEASPESKEVISALEFDATQNIDEESRNEAKQALKRIKIRELMQKEGWTNRPADW